MKQNWLLFGIDYDPRDDAAKAADPAPHLRNELAPHPSTVERISQVWFTGVRITDIGGGHPQDGLGPMSPLDWMLDRAEAMV